MEDALRFEHVVLKQIAMAALPPWLLCLIAWAVVGNSSAAESVPVPTLTVPLIATAPTIDGHCEENEWHGARLLALAAGPLESGSPTQVPPTSVRLAWRREALYLGFDCDDPSLIATPERDHDDTLYDEDVVEIFIDTVGDGHAYWEIQASPFARTTDGLHLLTGEPRYAADGRFETGFYRREHFWSTGFELEGLRVAASRRVGGWSVELAIPAVPLLRRKGLTEFTTGSVIHLNASRYDWSEPRTTSNRPLHQVSWSAFVTGCPHQSPDRMGILQLAP